MGKRQDAAVSRTELQGNTRPGPPPGRVCLGDAQNGAFRLMDRLLESIAFDFVPSFTAHRLFT